MNLGECAYPSPDPTCCFVEGRNRIIFDHHLDTFDLSKDAKGRPESLELAGPQRMIYFNSPRTRVAIVTCGGLCPGINDVIRAIVMVLHYRYGVKDILGIPFGFRGLVPESGLLPLSLTPDLVKDIHTLGGSILSSSRGHQDIGTMVNALVEKAIDMLFLIGGDGTMRAADKITQEITRRNLPIAIIGIPKTIDNDLNLIDKTFGFDTAISEAVKVIQCAHVEAKGAPMGIGLVKIMGRESGHIAVNATLAQSDVNFTLIPEVPFDLYGENGFLAVLEKRLRSRRHAVILVAEGAGQDLFSNEGPLGADQSGNPRLKDIGLFLKNKIEEYFLSIGMEINLKYIDPSYIIRSVPATATDSIYCDLLGQYAVHAAMAGKTGMVLGLYHNEYVHLPIKAVTSRRKVDVKKDLWMRVLEATGQPMSMKK